MRGSEQKRSEAPSRTNRWKRESESSCTIASVLGLLARRFV
jgi:hypothetical protein